MKACTWVVVVAILAVSSVCFAAGDDVFLFSYFKSNGETGVFLAYSEDGLTFKTLNDGRPVFAPPQWQGQNLTRDPSIVYRDGLFHMVWTSSWVGSCFGAAVSADLKEWSEPVRVEPFKNWPADDSPANTWAPEAHWDPVQKNYAILWSSATAKLESDGGHDSGGLEKDPTLHIAISARHHRTFVSRTTDFKTFTDAQVFFSPGVSTIDACMAFDDRGTADTSDDRWVMAVKDEQHELIGGKNVRLTTAGADLTNPFPPQFHSPTDPTKPWSDPIVGPGAKLQPNQWVEGPTLLKLGDEWRIYFDRYRVRNGRYGLITSKDLIEWTDRTAELSLPPDAHHGTILLAPRSAVFKAFSGHSE